MIRLLSGVTGIFRSLTLTAYLTLAILALGAALIFSWTQIGSQRAEIRGLKADLATAAKSLERASDDIERFAKVEGVSAAEAARICSAEGDSAFTRGRQFGIAEGKSTCAA